MIARKATKKKGAAPDKAARAELKRNIASIKKLLKQRDYGIIDTGVELARSLDEPAVFEEFLKDCTVDKEGQLVRNRMFSGTGPAQPYLDYALLNLVGYAPETTNLDKSLKRSNIKSLDLSRTEGWTELPSGINSFTNLTSLDLRSCDALQNVDGLANLIRLTSLDLTWCSSLETVDALANLTKLTSLNLESCSSLYNVDGLANLTKLTSLNLSSCYDLQNVDGLADCTNLTSLDLSSASFASLPVGLEKIPNLTSLDLSWCESLQNVDGLASCTSLTSLDLGSCYLLENVDGLANCTKLTSLNLRGDRNSLQNVDGPAGCTNLTSLNLRFCGALQNVDGLAKLANLTKLNLHTCMSLKPKPSPVIITSRQQVAAYQERIKKAMK